MVLLLQLTTMEAQLTDENHLRDKTGVHRSEQVRGQTFLSAAM